MVDKTKKPFQIVSEFEPMGDQINAIEELAQGVFKGKKHQILKGATGTGKTYVIVKMLERLAELEGRSRQVIVLSPNKTLAAQLYGEIKDFMPENAVTYFVSYYDYYQPESYLPEYDKLIEKESSINEEIDRYRNETTRSLIEREDVVVIASVSCIYGLGSPEYYENLGFDLQVGQKIPRDDILRSLIDIQYERNEQSLNRGSFRAKGDRVELYPSYEWNLVQINFGFGDEIDSIKIIDPINRKTVEEKQNIFILPAKQYVMPEEVMMKGLETIEAELEEHLIHLRQDGKAIEAQRLKQRTSFDLEMLKTTGYCQGIENYSAHFDSRFRDSNYKVNQIPPNTLIDFFPDDFILIVDESHVALPQVQGMLEGDRSRKRNLVDYGFRLPSAFDNRPLSYNEFYKRVNQVVYVTATPGDRELSYSGDNVVDQVIRPTGLIDPEVIVKSTEGQIDDLLEEIRIVIERGERVLVTTLTKKMAEHLTEYLQDAGIKAQYLHSDIDTLERNKIIRDLRLAVFDVLVGINLLREGLDLPEVALVTIFDADKEGFLRTTRSLIQIIGRASRNIRGRAVLYADNITKSMREAIDETNRRRDIQTKYNKEHGITPKQIIKSVKEYALARESAEVVDQVSADVFENEEEFEELISSLQQQMRSYAEQLEFEKAAKVRDQINELRASRSIILTTTNK
ncbi:MAG: excinuclease ABC subunit UvrB [Candidatus Hodarchaeales archaeon]